MSDNTSIHDLLVHEEADEAPTTERQRTPSWLGWLIKTTLYAAGLAALGILGLRALGGVTMPYVLGFSIVFALLALRRLVRLVAAPPPTRATARRAAVGDDEVSYRWDTVDGLRSAVGKWESRLEWGTANPNNYHHSVRVRLVELVDERLRQRHGISLTADPARARALLGEPLWTVLNDPAGKPPSPRQLAAVVAQLEAL